MAKSCLYYGVRTAAEPPERPACAEEDSVPAPMLKVGDITRTLRSDYLAEVRPKKKAA